MVLLILAAVWAVFLVPQVLRARAEGSPSDSIVAFRKQLAVLARTGARRDGSPSTVAGFRDELPPAGRASSSRLRRHAMRQRRRRILAGLLAAMGVTLVLGLIPAARPLLVVHLLLDLLCAGYVALLIRARSVSPERNAKVLYLPRSAPVEPDPALLLRRSDSDRRMASGTG